TAVGLDLLGNAVAAGYTASSNFPTANAFQGALATSGYDAYAARVLWGPNVPRFSDVSTDSGASAHDQITTYQNLTFNGTSDANVTVTLYRAGVGQIGSTTASAGGLWTISYTGTTLAEGTYAFTATATSAGGTSDPSAAFLVAVDRTAPAVPATVPSATPSYRPRVQVAAADAVGLAANAAVTLDVDLNNDGLFTGVGESGYASGTLADGMAEIVLPALSGTGTYHVRARVT